MKDNVITNIYMVRHAHSSYVPGQERTRGLSEKGMLDTLLIADILMKENIDHVYSSPYQRAILTVAEFAKRIQKEIIVEENFRERRVSEYEFVSNEEVMDAIRSLYKEPELTMPGGESNQIAQDRGIRALKNVINKHKGEAVAIGIHGNIMTIIMNYFDSRYDFEFWKSTTMPDIYKMSFDGDGLIEVTRLWD